jgi:hypothetical protein
MTSWQKMWKRIDHWASQGYIFELACISEDSIKKESKSLYKQDRISGRSSRTDRALLTAINNVLQSDADVISSALEQYRSCRFIKSDRSLGQRPSKYPVVKDINTMKDKLLSVNNLPSSQHIPPAYTPETSIEFHQLLIALLIAYRRALILRRLAQVEESRKKGAWHKTEHDEEEKFEPDLEANGLLNTDIWNYAFLFWRLTSSRMFLDHLDVLRNLAAPKMPVKSDAEKYSLWLEGEGEEEVKAGGTSEVVAAVGAEAVVRKEADEEVGADAREETDEEVGGEPNDDDVDEHINMFIGDGVRCRDTELFTGWVRLNTSHFTSIHMLSLGPSTLRNISHISVKQPPSCTDTLNWHEAISALDAPDFDVPILIEMLQDCIDDRVVRNDSSAIFYAFGSDKPRSVKGKIVSAGSVKFTGNYHCEMVLVALIVFFRLLNLSDDTLINVIKVR